MLEAAVVVLAVGVVVLLVLLLRRAPGTGDPEIAQLRQELNVLRQTTDRSLQNFGTQLSSVGAGVNTVLSTVAGEVGNRLDALNQNVAQRLNENVGAMSATSKAVNDRMANVQSAFAGLQRQIGEMSEQARNLSEMSRSLTDLQRALSAPRLRGGFGEVQLEALLSQVFARDQFQMQYGFPSGDIADAVLKFPQGVVAIDSKFPLENFRRMAESATDADKKAARKEFLRDVRRRIDEIAGKYVRPADGTLPFALAFIPAENVYYEAIIRDEEGNDLHEYCVERRVFPVSPNSLYAYLQTIVIGLKGLQISRRAESILRQIDTLQVELGKFSDGYSTLGKHLKNAADRFDEGSRQLERLETRVESLAGNGAGQMLLELEASADEEQGKKS
jgi:DNA recombination protein RmuC